MCLFIGLIFIFSMIISSEKFINGQFKVSSKEFAYIPSISGRDLTNSQSNG